MLVLIIPWPWARVPPAPLPAVVRDAQSSSPGVPARRCVATVTDAEGQGLVGPSGCGGRDRDTPGLAGRQQATFAWKDGGLDASGLAAKVGVSSITLGGLVKHLAFIEDSSSPQCNR